MNFQTTLCLVILFLSGITLWSQEVDWATHLAANGFSFGNAVHADANGNYYITGYFNGSLNFGSQNLNGAGFGDLFIAKYGIDRSLKWARRGTSEGWNGGRDIAVDSEGNVFVAGRIDGATSFNGITVTSQGENDASLTKYSSDGEVQWAKSGGGSGMDWANSVAVDAVGNSYVVGYFAGTASFQTEQLISSGENDIFIASYSPEGALRWVKGAGGTDIDEAYGVAVDPAGDVYVVGAATGSANFSGTIFEAGTRAGFLAKYDTDGSLKWVKGSANNNITESISINPVGEIFICGTFSNNLTLGTESASSAGEEDIYVARYNALGTVDAIWSLGGTGSDGVAGFGKSMDILAANDGGFYITSSFEQTLTLGEHSAESAGMMDIFLARYNKSGQPEWLVTAEGTDREQFVSLGVDGYSNCYLFGNYFSPTTTIGSTTLPRTNTIDMLLAKVRDLSVPQEELPKATFSNSKVNFGDVPINSTTNRTITITPGSNAELIVTKVYFDDPAADSKGFSLTAPTSGDLPVSLSNPSQELEVTVDFTAKIEGATTTSLVVETNDPLSPTTTIPISGFGITGDGELPTAVLSTTTLDFGKVAISYNSRKTFTISGANAAGLDVKRISFKEPNSYDMGFDLISPQKGDLPTFLNMGENLEVIVEFTAAEFDPVEATLLIETNDGLQPVREVTVRGKGSNLPKAEISTFTLDFGNTKVNTPVHRTLNITAGSDAGLTLSDLRLDGSGARDYRIVSPEQASLPLEIDEGKSVGIELEFLPQDTGVSEAQITVGTNDPFLSEASISLSGIGEPSSTTSIDEERNGQKEFSLFPNPMRLEGEIHIDLPSRGQIQVSLIDLNGRRVMELYEGEYRGGAKRIPCNVRALETGTYFCVVEIGEERFYRMLGINK